MATAAAETKRPTGPLNCRLGPSSLCTSSSAARRRDSSIIGSSAIYSPFAWDDGQANQPAGIYHWREKDKLAAEKDLPERFRAHAEVKERNDLEIGRASCRERG